MSKGKQLASGLTPDEERFAALLAEGKSQCDALVIVWPHTEAWERKSQYEIASKRAAKVASRVQEITDAVAERTEITLESLTIKALEDREHDKQNGRSGVPALKLVAGMHGLLKERESTGDILAGIVNVISALDERAARLRGDRAEVIEGDG